MISKAQPAPAFDILELLSRWIMQVTFAVAIVVAVGAPLLAISWGRQPFPGLLVEPTLVVTRYNGAGWSGRAAGLDFPQRIVRVAGGPVPTSGDYQAVVAAHEPGQEISVLATLPDGSMRLYPSLALGTFATRDMVRLFLVPYLSGVIYLGIAFWIYRARGRTRPGRALAFFSVCTAITCCLIFDLATTHVFPAVWMLAVAQLGGAQTTLALRFPVEWRPVQSRPWLLALPYAVSLALAGWGVWALYMSGQPWAYRDVQTAVYLYAALGTLVFLAVMLYRAFTSGALVVRQQARVVLLGGLVAFAPIVFWFVAPLLGRPLVFDALLFLPELLIFPLAVALAILRFRLLEMDLIINRTIVYGLLTAILGGGVTAGVLLTRTLFVNITGERGDVAVVVTTLIAASAINPLRGYLQAWVDGRFRQLPESTLALESFGQQVQSFVDMNSVERVTRHLVAEAARGLQAESAALSLVVGGSLQTVHTHGLWRGRAWAVLPLECDGERQGMLALGPRASQIPYTQQELETVREVATHVACAVRRAERTRLPSSS